MILRAVANSLMTFIILKDSIKTNRRPWADLGKDGWEEVQRRRLWKSFQTKKT